MPQDIGKLSQSMPPVKAGMWLWTEIYKKNPKEYSKERFRDKCFICNEKYSKVLGNEITPMVYDCEKCYQMIIEEDFKNWTSGNQELDIVIRESQLNAKKSNGMFLEVIPFSGFGKLEKIGEGGFSIIYLGNKPGTRYQENSYFYNESILNWREFELDLIYLRDYGRVALKSFIKSDSNFIANLAKEVF